MLPLKLTTLSFPFLGQEDKHAGCLQASFGSGSHAVRWVGFCPWSHLTLARWSWRCNRDCTHIEARPLLAEPSNQTFETSAENSTVHCASWSFELCDIKGYLLSGRLDRWTIAVSAEQSSLPFTLVAELRLTFLAGASGAFLLGCRRRLMEAMGPKPELAIIWPHWSLRLIRQKMTCKHTNRRWSCYFQHGRRQRSLN